MDRLKRLNALVLAGVLCLSLLAGCQQGAASSASGSVSGSASTSAQEAPVATVDLNTVADICTYLSGLNADEVVATADGMDITAGELMYWLVYNCDQMSNDYYYYQGTDELPWNTVDESTGSTFSDYLRQVSVTYAATQRIIEKNAKAAGVSVKQVDKGAIQASLETLAEYLAADTDKITVEQYLWQQGLTSELYTWNCEMDYLYQGLSDYYFGKGGEREPTEEILLSYLDDEGYYSVKHILLETKEATDEVKAQKKAKAEELLAQIKAAGGDEAVFDKLMKEHSEDPGLAQNPEGYVFQANTNIDPAFEMAALALEPGQLSDIVEGVHGYHILLRTPMKVTQELKQTFVNDQMGMMVGGWIELAEIKTTDACDKLDPKTIYQAMTDYRNTIAAITAE